MSNEIRKGKIGNTYTGQRKQEISNNNNNNNTFALKIRTFYHKILSENGIICSLNLTQ
jgi:hypothetical protein